MGDDHMHDDYHGHHYEDGTHDNHHTYDSDRYTRTGNNGALYLWACNS